MKKLLATIFIAGTISGIFAAAAPSASAGPGDELIARVRATIEDSDTPCVRVNVTIFGNRIGTGSEPICL